MPIVTFLASAFSGILGFLFRTVIVKFVIFSVVFIAFSHLLPIILDFALTGFSGDLPSVSGYVGFVLQYFNIESAVKLLTSAYVTRFLIRRMPFVGG